jgi:DnaK suppressor protein
VREARYARPATTPPALLSSAERSHLERRLLQERASVLRSLGSVRFSKSVEAGDRTPALRMSDHMAELGGETAQDSFDGVVATRATLALAEIDSALRRLYNEPHRFGLDERSGEAIPFERLDIIPWARRTVTGSTTR